MKNAIKWIAGAGMIAWIMTAVMNGNLLTASAVAGLVCLLVNNVFLLVGTFLWIAEKDDTKRSNLAFWNIPLWFIFITLTIVMFFAIRGGFFNI